MEVLFFSELSREVDMKKILDAMVYISFLEAVVATITLIVAHLIDAKPFNATATGVGLFVLVCLVWVIAFDIMGRRYAKG